MGKQLDAGQRAALEEFKERYGENWKQELLDKWRTGAAVNALRSGNGFYLQQIRNQFGPAWLVKEE